MFPLGECHGVLLDSLCRCKVFTKVSLLVFHRSPLSLVSPVPKRPTVPAHCSYASGPIFAFQSPCTMRKSFLGAFLIVLILQLFIEGFDHIIVGLMLDHILG